MIEDVIWRQMTSSWHPLNDKILKTWHFGIYLYTVHCSYRAWSCISRSGETDLDLSHHWFQRSKINDLSWMLTNETRKIITVASLELEIRKVVFNVTATITRDRARRGHVTMSVTSRISCSNDTRAIMNSNIISILGFNCNSFYLHECKSVRLPLVLPARISENINRSSNPAK